MKFSIKSVTLAVVVAGLLVPSVSFATNGAWLIGFGAKSRSMGGTGVADNRGGLAAAFNPATMVDSGTRFDIGADLFSPPRKIRNESDTLGFTDEESNNNIFLIPNMGGTYQWDEKLTLGFAFVGAGLMTEYDQTANSSSCRRVLNNEVPGFEGKSCPSTGFNAGGIPGVGLAGNEMGVELVQMQVLPSIAYKIDSQHSVGATLVLAASFFRAEGLQAFQTGDGGLGFAAGTGNLTNKNWDHSFGGGYRLGWLGKFMDDKLRFGANYSSRVWMKEFNQYRNLFAEQGDFDIPESYSAGVAFDFTPKITATFDVQRINWSDVRSIGNPGPLASDPNNFFPLCQPPRDTNECLLGTPDGLGFGWRDQTVYKIGVDWVYNEKINFRAGWNYGKTPIPDDQVLFNLLAPATPEHHLTLGIGYELSETYVIDGSFVYAFSNTISGPTAFPRGGIPNPDGTNASIDMTQLSIGGALGIRF